MPVTLQQFIERLTQSGLFSAEELAAFQHTLPPEKRPESPQDLARELILADRLTRYQAEAVYRGQLKGLVMGNYVVLDKIGAGGMGEVLKAHHRKMDRVVALKVLPRKAMRSEDAVKRFYREVRVAARLIHPNIVTAFDADEFEGIHCLVMECVDGQDLAHIVKQHGPMSVDAAVECIIQAARGLEYAHAEGIVHRDIKPGNLLLDRKGTVKILDMGLARMELGSADEPERLTGSEQVMGTCDYMAPEQAEDTHAADHRADIYSLGCTFYRLLTGTPPYKADTLIKVLLAHREAPIPSLCAARQDVPEAVDAVCRKMLAKRPEDRYQSMGEVIEALEACQQDKAAAPAGPEQPSDSALTTFLDKLAHGGGTTGTKQRAATIAEETQPSVPDAETGKRLKLARLAAAIAHPKLSPDTRRKLFRYVGIGGGVALCVVLFGLLVTVLSRDGREKREGERIVTMDEGKKVRPPLAISPFDARKAKWYQQQWADYLRLPVEWENSIGMKFLLIPPGEFDMGSSRDGIEQALRVAKSLQSPDSYLAVLRSEAPQHHVRITQPFYLGKHEVTVGQFRRFVDTTKYQTDAEKSGKGGCAIDTLTGGLQQKPEFTWRSPGFLQTDQDPVVQVSWNDALAFCRWLSSSERQTKRLPTEAEREYATRAGTTSHYFADVGPNSLQRAANVADAALKVASPSFASWAPWDDRHPFTAPVGRFDPNAFGVYDMQGNVWEWCDDWYSAQYYHASPQDDPRGPVSGSERVLRGGSWHDRFPVSLRCAARFCDGPLECHDYVGFRVVCEIPTSPADLKKFAAAIKASKPEKVEAEPKAESGNWVGGQQAKEGARWALQFDGVKDFVRTDLCYDGKTPITIESLVKVTKSQAGSLVGNNNECGVLLWFASTDWRFNVHDGTDYRIATSNDPPVLNVWVHVAGVFDGQMVRLYVDGKRQRVAPAVETTHTPAPWPFMIAADPRGGPTPEHFLPACVAALRISKIARYDKDYTPQARFEPDEHTLVLYHFDEGQGDVLHDSSGNGRHGKIVGATWVRLGQAEIGKPKAESPPPLAVAPFDADQAKQHQRAWAEYLGLPVEREIDLPGGVKLTMVLIPPGEFLMGSPEAERQWALEEATATNDNRAIERIPTEVLHQVKITRPFYLGKYELTQAQWQAVMGNNPSKFQDPSSPVEQVSWDDIQRFLAKLNTAGTRRVPSAKTARAATEMKYALPTEAQWEYVCRGGTTTAFSFGDSVAMLGECAWSRSNSGGKTHPVDGLKANAWNLYDMYGNVWEWCMDWDAADYYAQSPPTDPPGPLSGSNRVYRGGGWASHPRSCRSASRNSYVPGHRNDGLGFRLALVPIDN